MTQLVTAAPLATASEPTTAQASGRVAGLLTRSIRTYQLARAGHVTGCRFIPSCSEYAVEAIGLHGALRGGALAARRLTRCTPWGGHGVDPVPDRRTPCTHP